MLLKKVNSHEDLVDNDPFKDEVTQEPTKPTPPPRTGKWDSVSRKNVNEDLILPPPEQFQDGYKPIPKPRTDRPLKIQNARRPLKPTRKPPPVPQVEEHIWAKPKPIPTKREPKKEVINNNQRPKVPPRIGKWANPKPTKREKFIWANKVDIEGYIKQLEYMEERVEKIKKEEEWEYIRFMKDVKRDMEKMKMKKKAEGESDKDIEDWAKKVEGLTKRGLEDAKRSKEEWRKKEIETNIKMIEDESKNIKEEKR